MAARYERRLRSDSGLIFIGPVGATCAFRGIVNLPRGVLE